MPSNDERYRGRVRTLRGPSEDGQDLGVEMRDAEQDNRNRDEHSHDTYFKGVKQRLRLNEALAQLLDQTAMPQGIRGVETMTVSDETWQDLMTHPSSWEEEGFTPLSSYAYKLITISGKVLRPLIPGEVGMVERDGKVIYLTMEEGKTPGIRVGVQIVDNTKKNGI